MSDNQAERQALADHLNSKMSVVASAGLEGLFSNGNSQRKTPKAKVPKVLTKEEQEKKDFDKDLEQNLVSHVFSICSWNLNFHVRLAPPKLTIFVALSLLRIGKLATKARDTAARLTETGIADQEAGSGAKINLMISHGFKCFLDGAVCVAGFENPLGILPQTVGGNFG